MQMHWLKGTLWKFLYILPFLSFSVMANHSVLAMQYSLPHFYPFIFVVNVVEVLLPPYVACAFYYICTTVHSSSPWWFSFICPLSDSAICELYKYFNCISYIPCLFLFLTCVWVSGYARANIHSHPKSFIINSDLEKYFK